MATELLLVKDGGFDLADVRGKTEVRRRTVEPAAWERALASAVEEPEARLAAGGAALIIALSAALYLQSAVAAVSAPLVAALVASAVGALSSFEAAAREEVEVAETEGMGDREAMRFAVLHDEHERMKAEKAEEAHDG